VRNTGAIQTIPSQEHALVTPDRPTSMPELGLTGTTRSGGGIRIVALVAGANAAVAYMHIGDIITELDGIPVRSASDFAADLSRRAPGTKIRLGYMMQTSMGSFGKEAIFVIQ
jgi:C-terminal processing protease CtpA/Prc